MKRVISTILAISFSLLSAITEAKIYKWTDVKGQIHYSATPPKPNEKNFNLKKDFSFSNKSESATNNEDKIAIKKEKSQNIDGKQAQKISNKKLEFCSKEKNNLKLLQQNSTVTWIENGKETPLSGKMLEDKIQVIKESIQTQCASSLKKNKL